MPYSGLNEFINVLEERGELARIKEFVDPVLEITEVADRISKAPGGGKALLFENTGTGFPLLINALGSEKRVSLALSRKNLSEIENEIESLFRLISSPQGNLREKLRLLPRLKEISSWMPKRIRGKGKCQEVVVKNPDLGMFPVLQCWPADGGRFLTLPCVHTIDPVTGSPNLGMYRMQVFSKDQTGMHWHKHKTGANHFEKYKKHGRKMPVSVSLGGDPVYSYAATAPMPENMDEYLLAGFLRKKQVRLVKCLTNDLFVPGDADIVIEGFVDPAEELAREGPFGDHTGFYSLADYYPRFHVTCITHRKDAVYPATIVGVPPMEDAYIGKATERIFLNPVRMAMIPELLDMDLPFAGVAHNLAVVKIKKSYAGQAVKVMNSLWGAGQMMFNKIMVVVDEKADIHNYRNLLKVIFSYLDPRSSLHFSIGPLDVLDHSSSKFAFGSKLGVDATLPFEEEIPAVGEELRPEKSFQDEIIKNIPFIESFYNLKNDLEIPVCIISLKKDEGFRKEKLVSQIENKGSFSFFKIIVIVDSGVDVKDLFSVVWLAGGNLEPRRDISVIDFQNGGSALLVDATIKTSASDNFQRDWPNLVTMNRKTIYAIDKKWGELKIGDYIPSPSKRFMPLVKGEGAVRRI